MHQRIALRDAPIANAGWPLRASEVLPAKRLKGASTMVRMTTMSSPFLLGFDEIERALERAAKTGSDGYPPYNIERIAAKDDTPECLRITLAVAGFSREDIEVTQEESQLWIRGRQREDKIAGLHPSRHRRATVPAQFPARRRHAGAWRGACERPLVDRRGQTPSGQGGQENQHTGARLKVRAGAGQRAASPTARQGV